MERNRGSSILSAALREPLFLSDPGELNGTPHSGNFAGCLKKA